MNPFLLFFFASLIALVAATYTDLRKRIVSNKLSYSMVASGLAGWFAIGFFQQDLFIFFNSVTATIASFAFSLLLYKAGVWAGGDVKLFTGLAAMNPFNPNILSRLGLISLPVFGAIQLPIFFATLFIFSLFAMLPYGIFLSLQRIARNKEHGRKILLDLWLFGIGFAVIVLGAAFAFLNGYERALALLWMVVVFWLLYFMLKVYSMSKVLMRKAIKITDLEEGMIPAETIVETGKGIERQPEMGIKNLIKYFAVNKFEKAIKQPREIVSSKKARGATKKEIEELRQLVKQGKLQDAITVKESAPMVPAVLIAYLALNVVGDLIWNVLL